jgi:predicted phage baseplate assembly protein
LGAAGNVRAGQLTTLLSRPLGVSSVVNPGPAAGGEDPERLEDARANAPRTVLTLGRAVSRLDYEDFARGFAGIAKAHAEWIATGPARGVVVTIAGPAGAAVLASDPTYLRLIRALRKAGDELLPLVVLTYRAATFRLSVDVKIDDASETEPTLAAVRAALERAFAFDARGFGQPVSIDEVAAVVHRVKSVLAVDVNILRRSDQSANPAVRPRLQAGLPVVSGRTVTAAEVLTLDTTTLVVGLMP